jgi:hypothetical protein
LRAGGCGISIVSQAETVILSKETLMNRFPRFRRRLDANKRRLTCVRLNLEFLEPRNLLNGTPTNVLVNNPAEDKTAQDTQNETAIVLGSGSKITVAFNDDFRSLLTSPTDSIIGYSVSGNTGASFQDQGILPPGPNGSGTDPVLARSNATGTIFMSTNQSNPTYASFSYLGVGVNVYRSTDDGVTFQQPASVAPGLVQGVDFEDKPWIAVDNTPGLGYGNVYLVWRDFSNMSADNRILFARSIDDGQTWGPSVVIQAPKLLGGNSSSFQGPFVTVGPDHAVDVFWWDFTQNAAILMRKSTDQGQTFGNAVTVTGLKTHGANGSLGLTDSTGRSFDTNAFPQAAVNPVTGDIYVVYDDQGHGSQDKADIYFTMSTDGGNTWSKSIRVNDDSTFKDQWQPSLAVTPDGTRLGIFWYDRRLDPANNLIDRFGVIGTVSGHSVTFAPNFRITDVSFPPAFDQDPFFVNAGVGGYMGDYDMATADNNYFYTTWGDNRLGDAFFANQPDVRFAKIPVTGLQTDTALATPNSSGGTQTVSATPATISLSTGVVLSTGGATTNVVGPLAQESNGQPTPLSVIQPLTPVGNNLGFNATKMALPGVLSELPSLESALLARFDALLSMGFDGYALQTAQENWLRDLLGASLF